MKKLLALLLTLSMLLGVGAMAEGEAQTAEVIEELAVELSDAYLTYGGVNYELNPTAELGWKVASDSILIDFALKSEDSKLLPMQMRIDKDGLGMQIGSSSSVYLFDAQYLESMTGIEMTEEGLFDMEAFMEDDGTGEMLELLLEELVAETGLPMTVEAKDAYLAEYAKLFGEGEPATVELDGETYDATKYTCTLDLEQVIASYDNDVLLFGEEWIDVQRRGFMLNYELDSSLTVGEAYRQLYSAVTQEVVQYEIAETGVVIQDFHSERVRLDGEEEADTDTRIVMYSHDNIVMSQLSDGDRTIYQLMPGASILTVEDDDRYEPNTITAQIVRNEAGSVDVTGSAVYENTVTKDNFDITFEFAPGAEGGFDLMAAMVGQIEGYGEEMNDVAFSLQLGMLPDGTGSGSIDIDYTDNSYGVDLSMGCGINIREAEVEDRITGKKVLSLTDTANESSMMMAFMGLMGDLERLMNEDSVAAMLEGVAATDEALMAESDVDPYAYYGNGPELPEMAEEVGDYHLSYAEYAYGTTYSSASLVYEGDEGLICAAMSASSTVLNYLNAGEEEETVAEEAPAEAAEEPAEETTEETAEEEGRFLEEVHPEVTMDFREGYARAVVSYKGCVIVIEAYDEAANYDVLRELISGISYPEEPEEEPAEEELKPAEGRKSRGSHTL